MIEEEINTKNFKHFSEKSLGELENAVKEGLECSSVFYINMGYSKEKSEEAGIYLTLKGYNITQMNENQRYWLNVERDKNFINKNNSEKHKNG